jgi:hypothetical protein
MILLRAGRLADAFRERRLSEEDKVPYVIVGAALPLLTQLWVAWAFSRRDLTAHAVVGTVLAIAGIVFGILWCFSANRRGDGVRFVERYLCLSVPATVQVYGTTFVIIWAFAVAMRDDFVPAASEPWTRMAVRLGVLIVFFANLRRCIARAAGAGRRPTSAARVDDPAPEGEPAYASS